MIKEELINELTRLNNEHLQAHGFSYYLCGLVMYNGKEYSIYESALSEIEPVGALFFRLTRANGWDEHEVLAKDLPQEELQKIYDTTIKLHKSHHNL